ncbi:hypothetical protein [Xenorhabdus sp. TH1]|uniref:hypothetical protein n=1 Tax=Xenorhabdus sp. TH1 TaxID=3130166 RepID=UPI0030D415F6
MTDNQNRIPVVLKNNQHAPIEKDEFIQITTKSNTLLGDGSSAKPLTLPILSLPNQTNRLKVLGDGLYSGPATTKMFIQKINVASGSQAVKTDNKGQMLISNSLDLSSWKNTLPLQSKIITFSWLAQTRLYTAPPSSPENLNENAIPFCVTSVHWDQIDQFSIEFLIVKKPSYWVHYLPTGRDHSPDCFYFNILFYYTIED